MATATTTTETPEEALQRIQSMGFGKNDALAIMAFSEAGIEPEEIEPRENVLTFRAWKAKGRQVAKGATSVRVTVWISKRGKKSDEQNGEETKGGMYPKTTYLFHESQTIPIGAEKGTRPAAWNNPDLVKPGTYEPLPNPVDGALGHVAETEAEETETGTHYRPVLIDENGVSEELAEQAADAECNCPMVGVVTNVDCPIHGGR